MSARTNAYSGVARGDITVTAEQSAAERAFDAYWETGPDDDPADFSPSTPIAEDAFMAGHAAGVASERARTLALVPNQGLSEADLKDLLSMAVTWQASDRIVLAFGELMEWRARFAPADAAAVREARDG